MNNKKGSALLFIIIITSITLGTIAIIWRSSFYVFELGFARQEYEQDYWNTSALMTWAVALCKENFDHFLNYTQHGAQKITVKKWPPVNRSSCQVKSCGALITLMKKESEHIAIKTMLKKKPKTMIFECFLKRTKNEGNMESFFIEGWSVKTRDH